MTAVSTRRVTRVITFHDRSAEAEHRTTPRGSGARLDAGGRWPGCSRELSARLSVSLELTRRPVALPARAPSSRNSTDMTVDRTRVSVTVHREIADGGPRCPCRLCELRTANRNTAPFNGTADINGSKIGCQAVRSNSIVSRACPLIGDPRLSPSQAELCTPTYRHRF